MIIEGLDVSQHQGTIDWPAVATVKRFAVIRGGDGRLVDAYFERNVSGAKQAGLHVETYHYLRWLIPSQEMADICRRTWEAAGTRLWLDCEDRQVAADPAALMPWLRQVISHLQGIELGLYSARWWWAHWMGDTAVFNQLPLWVSSYPLDPADPNAIVPEAERQVDSRSMGLRQPIMPAGWGEWSMWQFTQWGSCPGIQGQALLDIAQEEPGANAFAALASRVATLENIVKEGNWQWRP